MFDYTDEYQATVAAQMSDLKEKKQYFETLGMMNDYKKTRDSIRACQKHIVEK